MGIQLSPLGENSNDKNLVSILKEFSKQRIRNLAYLIIVPKAGILCTTIAIKLYVSGFQIRIF